MHGIYPGSDRRKKSPRHSAGGVDALQAPLRAVVPGPCVGRRCLLPTSHSCIGRHTNAVGAAMSTRILIVKGSQNKFRCLCVTFVISLIGDVWRWEVLHVADRLSRCLLGAGNNKVKIFSDCHYTQVGICEGILAQLLTCRCRVCECRDGV
jgi:hypothetical protein